MTAKINTNSILVSGTGKMGLPLIMGIGNDARYDLLPWAISEDIPHVLACEFENYVSAIQLIRTHERMEMLPSIWNERSPYLIIDVVPAEFSQENGEFYSKFESLPVIMMSTGIFDPSKLRNTLILPNACLQIVAWEKFLAEQKKNMFGKGYSLKIVESHQKKKKDVSGTAIKFVPYFNQWGLDFTIDQIESIRDENIQLSLGIPSMFLDSHALHKYIISSEKPDDILLTEVFIQLRDFLAQNPLFSNLDLKKEMSSSLFIYGNALFETTPYRTFLFCIELKTSFRHGTKLEISHSILGKQPYVEGALNHAIPFMQEKCQLGLTGENFSSLQLYDYSTK